MISASVITLVSVYIAVLATLAAWSDWQTDRTYRAALQRRNDHLAEIVSRLQDRT